MKRNANITILLLGSLCIAGCGGNASEAVVSTASPETTAAPAVSSTPTPAEKPDPQMIWVKEPEFTFTAVYDVETPSFSPDDGFFYAQGIYVENTGYAASWSGEGYREGVVLAVQDHYVIPYDFEGNPIGDGYDLNNTETPFANYVYFNKDFTSAENSFDGYDGLYAIGLYKGQMWATQSATVDQLDFFEPDLGRRYIISNTDQVTENNYVSPDVEYVMCDADNNILYTFADSQTSSSGSSDDCFVNGFFKWADASEGKYPGYLEIDGYRIFNADTGEKLNDDLYEDAGYFEDGYMPVRKDGKWAYINEKGEYATEFIFTDASALYEGKAYVKLNGKYGILDLKKTLETVDCVTGDLAGVKDSLLQIKVLVDQVRIRSEADTSSKDNIIGHLEKDSVYEVYETKEADGYTWYNIGTGWIAYQDGWYEVLE